MGKKTVIQIILISLIILITLSFYLKYFNKNPKVLINTPPKTKTILIQNDTSTYIDNIDYISFDVKGNKYQITAKQSEIKIENTEIMFLTDVIAYIFIKDSDTVKITSNFGKYNTKNYDTFFSENVIVIYPGHKITGEYLDFSLINNIGIFSTNVFYVSDKTKMFADKIEIDLITNNTKIFMIDNSEKVLIERVN